MLGMILSITVLPLKYRLLFLIICSFGIVLTFSRGALLCLPIVISILAAHKIIQRNQLLFVIFGLSITIFCLGVSGNFIVNYASDLGLNDNAKTRIQAFIDPISNWEAGDDTSRIDIIPFALQNFSNHPFFGNGIGFTQTWGEILPHNIYLLFMVEHGILGTLIFPTLILSIVNKSLGEVKSIGQAFAVFVLIWGIFSHNILDERYSLVAFSLMTAMNVDSQLEYKSRMKHKV